MIHTYTHSVVTLKLKSVHQFFPGAQLRRPIYLVGAHTAASNAVNLSQLWNILEFSAMLMTHANTCIFLLTLT